MFPCFLELTTPRPQKGWGFAGIIDLVRSFFYFILPKFTLFLRWGERATYHSANF